MNRRPAERLAADQRSAVDLPPTGVLRDVWRMFRSLVSVPIRQKPFRCRQFMLRCPYGNRRQRSESSRPATSSIVSSAKPRAARSFQAAARRPRSRQAPRPAHAPGRATLPPPPRPAARSPRPPAVHRRGGVAPAAPGERERARARGPGVVHGTRARKRRDRPLRELLPDAASQEPLPEPAGGNVAAGDGSRRQPERLRSSKLPAKDAEERAVELDAGSEPAAKDDLVRDDAPVAVDFQRDAAGSRAPDGGQPRGASPTGPRPPTRLSRPRPLPRRQRRRKPSRPRLSAGAARRRRRPGRARPGRRGGSRR